MENWVNNVSGQFTKEEMQMANIIRIDGQL